MQEYKRLWIDLACAILQFLGVTWDEHYIFPKADDLPDTTRHPLDQWVTP